MSWRPQQRPNAIRTDKKGDNSTNSDVNNSPAEPAPAPAEAGRLAVGWWLVIVVWVCGFLAVFLSELGNFLWRALRGMF
jgi:hypothetical protein